MSSKLRILVPVKRVIDAALKPRINKTNTGVDTKGIKFSMNPFDDIAVEEAIKIREQHKSMVDSIHAVSIGPSKAQDILRTALAKGCDTSTLVDVKEEEIEPLQVSKILKKIVEQEKSNLIIMGKQAIDDDFNQTGQMLLAMLNWPQLTNASKVEITGDDSVIVTREIDGGEQVLKLKLPMIITTDLRLNEPKFVTLPKMMKAKKKPLTTVTLGDLGIDLTKKLEILKVEEPPLREPGIKVANVDQLIEKLKDLKAI